MVKLLIIFLLVNEVAYADLSGEMDNFLDGVGFGSNTTNASSYSGQEAGYYTGPSTYIRTPIKTVNLASIRLPEVRMGCGGIDIFTGGLSHINADAFVGLLNSIARNASGVAFMTALHAICPSCASTLDKMQKVAQGINNFNINSCNAAKRLVGGIAGTTESGAEAFCKTKLSNNTGTTDYAAAVRECTEAGRVQNAVDSASKEEKEKFGVNTNIVWAVLSKNSTLSTQQKELFMSVSGTLINKMKNNAITPEHKPSLLDEKSKFIQAMLEGGSNLKIYKCDNDECLNPTTENVTIVKEDAVKERIHQIVDSISEKYKSEKAGNREELSDAENEFILGLSYGISILKIIEVQSIYKKALPTINLDNLETYIALDLIYKFVMDIMEYVEGYTYTDIATGSAPKKELLSKIKTLKTSLNQAKLANMEQLRTMMDYTETVKRLEKNMSQSIGGFY